MTRHFRPIIDRVREAIELTAAEVKSLDEADHELRLANALQVTDAHERLRLLRLLGHEIEAKRYPKKEPKP